MDDFDDVVMVMMLIKVEIGLLLFLAILLIYYLLDFFNFVQTRKTLVYLDE